MRIDVRVPELGADQDGLITVCLWHSHVGDELFQGDRLKTHRLNPMISLQRSKLQTALQRPLLPDTSP